MPAQPTSLIPFLARNCLIGILTGLILINGLFALAEMAIVSARRERLQALAEGGHSCAAVALRMAQEPTALLSTVQIGITLIGILAGAFGGAGGSSAFGSRAGDAFTRFTIIVASIWILLIMLLVKITN